MEDRRKCFKCGCSPAKDEVKLFRFPKPGVFNLIRCFLWAKYMFPEKDENDYALINFQKKLHSEHRMLCQRHFKDADYADNFKKTLRRTAVPCDIIADSTKEINVHLFRPGHIIPCRDNYSSTLDSGNTKMVDVNKVMELSLRKQ